MEICGGENCSHFGELSQGQLELCHGDGSSLGLQYSDNHKLCQCWLQSFWSSLDLLLSYANVISALFRFQFSGNSDNSCMYSLRTGSFSLVLQFQSVMHRYRRCDEIEEHVVATKWIHYKSHLLWQWQANKRSKASEQNKSLKRELWALVSCIIWNYFCFVQHIKTKHQWDCLQSLLTLEKKKTTTIWICLWIYTHSYRSIITEMIANPQWLRHPHSIWSYFLGHSVDELLSSIQLGWKVHLGYVYSSKLNILVN